MTDKCPHYYDLGYAGRCDCQGNLPSPWRDVREELIKWIADNTFELNHRGHVAHLIDADFLMCAIEKLFSAPPEKEE